VTGAARAMGRALVFACVLAGCGARDTAREFTLGDHQVRVEAPSGWETLDQGRVVRFKNARAELVLQDLGPAGPQGIRREVERARDLWRSGQAAAAATRLGSVPVPRDLFPTPETGREFWAAWSRVSRAPEETPFADVEPAFADILANVDAMPARSLAALVDAGLASLGHDSRRDVKSRGEYVIDGRPAQDVETWNRLTHDYPQRLLFVLNDGYLLVLAADQGAGGDVVKAFERMRASLHFADGKPRR